MRNYWATDPDLSVPFVFSRMSRFEEILRNLHVKDNQTITAGKKKNKKQKTGFSRDLLNFHFKQLVKPGTYLSVDDSIIFF